MKLELVLNGKIPSGNTLLRMHWAKRGRMIRDWHWLVKQALQKNETLKNSPYVKGLAWSFCNSKVRCDVMRFYGQRGKPFDDANLIHAVDKLIVDNLVKEGILVSDSPEWFEWGKIGQAEGTKNSIRLTLEEI